MLLAIAVLAIVLLGYVVKCLRTPFAPCRKCRGLGKIQRFKKLRTCPRCHDDKYRLRVGRRIHNSWRRTYGDGTRPTPSRFGSGR